MDKLEINRKKINSIQQQLAGLCVGIPEIKYLAQKSLVSYMRSIHLQAAKDIFNVENVDLKALSHSLGLVSVPKIKFCKSKNTEKNAILKRNEDEEDEEEAFKQKDKITKLYNKRNNTVLSSHYNSLRDDSEEDEDDEGFMTITRADHALEQDAIKEAEKRSKIESAAKQEAERKRKQAEAEATAAANRAKIAAEQAAKEAAKTRQQRLADEAERDRRQRERDEAH